MIAQGAMVRCRVAALRLAGPSKVGSRWHVSAAVDLNAYAFSWAWLLVPSFLLGRKPHEYVILYVVASILSAVHVHFTFPCVYLDPAVRRRRAGRFVVLPMLLVLLFVARVLFAANAAPSTFARAFNGAMLTVGVLVGAWNVWHVLMQKYGILRLYNAKRDAGLRRPAWVDRLLVLAWLGFLPAILVREAPLIAILLGDGPLLRFFIDVATPLSGVLFLGSWTIAASAVAIFLHAEWRADQLRDGPRLAMAIGTCLLSVAVVIDPIRGGLAYVFSHAVEYMVFVWAFHDRKYAKPTPADPPLAHVLGRPWLAYGGYVLVLGSLFAYFGPWSHARFHYRAPRLLGIETGEGWIMAWLLFVSALHFYYDGFLWRMRSADVRAHL